LEEDFSKTVKNEIECEKHGKQVALTFGEQTIDKLQCPKCFNEYWKKKYFL